MTLHDLDAVAAQATNELQHANELQANPSEPTNAWGEDLEAQVQQQVPATMFGIPPKD